MTVTLELKPSVQAEIEEQARLKGISVEDYVLQVIESLVPAKEFDLDALLSKPREEQSRILQQAAELAAFEYEKELSRHAHERELTAFTALDGEEFMDDLA